MGLEAEMEVSALRYSGGTGLHGRSPLLRLQSDERLVTLIRRGNQNAFEVLVARYNSRLLAFCRHMLGSREDAEDVLQDVFTASYNALLADSRPINVRPWLYRIARNRCLNHLRRNKAIGVDSMDIHFSEYGATTADKVHEREEFRQLLDDIRDLPETQRTALVLREMDALSYEQIAEAMDTTVSSVKSLLVRARVSLTEAAEARLLTCDEVREELAEVAEGMRRKQSTSVRRHVKNCTRCQVFQGEMRRSSRALAALAPIGPLALFQQASLRTPARTLRRLCRCRGRCRRHGRRSRRCAVPLERPVLRVALPPPAQLARLCRPCNRRRRRRRGCDQGRGRSGRRRTRDRRHCGRQPEHSPPSARSVRGHARFALAELGPAERDRRHEPRQPCWRRPGPHRRSPCGQGHGRRLG